MDITQTFYDSLASQYDKLFMDWNATTHEQAVILDRIFRDNGFDFSASVLDCACGIGTQSIGLASLDDISQHSLHGRHNIDGAGEMLALDILL